jgi:hypothetical protein
MVQGFQKIRVKKVSEKWGAMGGVGDSASPRSPGQLAAQSLFVPAQALQGVVLVGTELRPGRQRLDAGLGAGQLRQHDLAGMPVALALGITTGPSWSGLWAGLGC